MNKPFAITPTLASAIADAMSKLAETHPNDMIANQYARTAEKLEEFGAPFAPGSRQDRHHDHPGLRQEPHVR